jgi:hypothetical protein
MHNRPDHVDPPRRRSWLRRWRFPLIGGAALLAISGIVAVAPTAQASVPFNVENLDGSANNANHPTWGQAGLAYARVGTAHYADGISQPVSGPNARLISNRLFNDKAQNVFSERRLDQWAWTWGQFLDHTFGHRIETGAGADAMNIPFSSSDALEDFHSNLTSIPFNRSPQTTGTGTSTSNPRQQTNQLASYINGNPVYGVDNTRLDWLRQGPVDGDPTNNSALLMLPGGYLPTAADRGNASAAPAMDRDGRLLSHPNDAYVAGDVRANENIALTATHTLFAREHNRIVGLLPSSLSDEDKFQIARRVVMAEEQYITYQEFLPAMGVALPKYTGYNANVNATLTNEFATVGYRAHSQIHGDGIEVDDVPSATYSAADVANLQAQGLTVTDNGDGTVSVDVPLGVMFFNPGLLKTLQEDQVLKSLENDPQYNNDVEIDNQLRSTLFQVPSSTDATCLNGPTMPNCFNVVNDLGALDVQRNRDHGIGTLNQLRQAYGLSAYTSFTALTGESTDALPSGTTINSPGILDVTSAKDIDGNAVTAGDPNAQPTVITRRATVAARLKAVYGSIDSVDAFTGVFAEKHMFGAEFGPTMLAIWAKQFQALRDGDRFYFGNDQGLSFIKSNYGIDYKHTLGQIILMNTNLTASDLNPTGNVFFLADSKLPATTCQVTYTITNVTSTTFQGNLAIKNTSNATISNWSAAFGLYQGQAIQKAVSGASFSESGFGNSVKTATPVFANRNIAPGATATASFVASWDGILNQKPPNINLPARRCAVV